MCLHAKETAETNDLRTHHPLLRYPVIALQVLLICTAIRWMLRRKQQLRAAV